MTVIGRNSDGRKVEERAVTDRRGDDSDHDHDHDHAHDHDHDMHPEEKAPTERLVTPADAATLSEDMEVCCDCAGQWVGMAAV